LLQPVLPAPTRKPRRRKNPVLPRTQRQSTRLAAKTKGSYVDIASQAIKRKALLNSLAGCSAGLKKQVTKRNILSRSKLPVSVLELRKLVLSAKVTCKSLDITSVENDVDE
jgi:hypothetical protein